MFKVFHTSGIKTGDMVYDKLTNKETMIVGVGRSDKNNTPVYFVKKNHNGEYGRNRKEIELIARKEER